MIYEDCKIYGPYVSKQDGRLRIIVADKHGKKTTVSYPKYLMEIHLGRYLTSDETVDHIDCNFQNNEISNLRVLSRSEHASIDVRRYETQSFECPMCNRNFSLNGKKLHDAITARKRNRAGPFCSRTCAGHYGRRIQLGENPLKVKTVIPSYTTLKSKQEPS